MVGSIAEQVAVQMEFLSSGANEDVDRMIGEKSRQIEAAHLAIFVEQTYWPMFFSSGASSSLSTFRTPSPRRFSAIVTYNTEM